MGNILELDRNFSGGSAGQLRFTYDGNQLSGCSDINITFPIPEKYRYLKYTAMGNNSYLYDLNGNETMNLKPI